MNKDKYINSTTVESVIQASMNRDKDFKSRSKKRKREEGKALFLKGV